MKPMISLCLWIEWIVFHLLQSSVQCSSRHLMILSALFGTQFMFVIIMNYFTCGKSFSDKTMDFHIIFICFCEWYNYNLLVLWMFNVIHLIYLIIILWLFYGICGECLGCFQGNTTYIVFIFWNHYQSTNHYHHNACYSNP